MIFRLKSLVFPALGAILAGASCSSAGSSSPATVSSVAGIDQVPQSTAMPHARIYRTSGNYAQQVPVTLNETGTEVVSYPAPSDITADSAPVELTDGYLLDRRGIGPHTAFTTFTYAQYSSLPQAPAARELMKAVIPGARVVEIVEMPFFTGQADAAARCNELIAKGLPGCKTLYSAPVLNLQ